MKRNIIVILTLTLVCVLFVACGKEEVAPIDIAIGELQAARENIDNQIAALEAQRPATVGDSTVIPVGKTREEMTEKEKEVYDKAKVEELNAILIEDRYYAFEDVHDEEGIYAYIRSDRTVVYCPKLADLPENVRANIYSSIMTAYEVEVSGDLDLEDYEIEQLAAYFDEHEDVMIEIMTLATIARGSRDSEPRDKFKQRVELLCKEVFKQ